LSVEFGTVSMWNSVEQCGLCSAADSIDSSYLLRCAMRIEGEAARAVGATVGVEEKMMHAVRKLKASSERRVYNE
jgi:hypothetical protein